LEGTEQHYAEILAQLASNETEHKSFKRRLEEHDELLKEQNKILIAIERQSNAIESMNKSMSRVETKVDGINGRVEALEKEPAEKWKKTSWEVLKYVLLAIVGLIVGMIIKAP
jgi:predicted nuclease with TOPRIM domain